MRVERRPHPRPGVWERRFVAETGKVQHSEHVAHGGNIALFTRERSGWLGADGARHSVAQAPFRAMAFAV